MLRDLDEKVSAVCMEAFAPSTMKTKAAQWRVYEQFCELYDLQPLPIEVENVCRFLVYKSDTVCYTTFNNYVSALNILSKTDKGSCDLRDDFAVSLTLQGLRRILGDSSLPKSSVVSRPHQDKTSHEFSFIYSARHMGGRSPGIPNPIKEMSFLYGIG